MEIKIMGNAFRITSALAVKDIQLLAVNAPEKLKIKDEEGNVKFAIAYNEASPSLKAFGLAFDGKTRDENAKATFTGTIPASTEDPKAFVAEKICDIFAYLTELETSVPSAARAVETEVARTQEQKAAARQRIIEMITEA